MSNIKVGTKKLEDYFKKRSEQTCHTYKAGGHTYFTVCTNRKNINNFPFGC